eukprot:jgi/Undpi1/13347/HiC_scaffold_8.g03006.m1
MIPIAQRRPDLFAEPSEIELLQEGLRCQGRWLIDVADDGNCLFRSLSFHANGGNEHDYEKIRAVAIGQLRTGAVSYSFYEIDGANATNNGPIEIAFLAEDQHYMAVEGVEEGGRGGKGPDDEWVCAQGWGGGGPGRALSGRC